MENADVARILDEMADILEIQEANVFRVRSYRQAAQTIRGLSEPLRHFESVAELQELPNVGEGIAEKIRELLETGKLEEHRELLAAPEAGLIELLKIPGVGPKQAKLFFDELEIQSIDELEAAGESGKLRELKGLGEKSERKILDGIQQVRRSRGRFRLDQALPYAERFVDRLEAIDSVDRISVAGSLRRRRETVGDVDILVTCRRPREVMAAFVETDDVEEVLAQGETKSSVRLRNDLQVDLRVVPDASYGAALHYFTGSKEHNIAVRQRGVKRDLKINEYGVFPADGTDADEGVGGGGDDDPVAGQTEEEVFEAVELPWIPPELRENRGEIEAAESDGLPKLIELDDIRGDCQMHSTHSDGKNTIREMAEAAAARGHGYVVITDHSKRVSVANGLDEERLLEEWREIDRIDEELEGIRVLKGVEVDILVGGDLDLEDECLAGADVVVASIHYNTNLDRDEMTGRILRALDSPHVDILAHPTGRRLLEREPFAVDLEAVLERALERGVMMEINASPERLDLNDVHARMAKEAGVPLVISTDAHSVHHLDFMRFGISVARRAWLEPGDVANTRDVDEFLQMIDR